MDFSFSDAILTPFYMSIITIHVYNFGVLKRYTVYMNTVIVACFIVHCLITSVLNALTTAPSSSNVQLSGCPHIITRSQWHAATPSRRIGHLTSTPSYVFTHHGDTPGCFTQAACTSRIQGYQRSHLQNHGEN